jgi:pimeloyl-ACP methyl ester carboxylesterase
MNRVAAVAKQLSIQNTVVVLIHGIRTRAMWQGDIKNALEAAGLVAIPTNYNKFDFIRFLLPFDRLRLAPIRKVEGDIKAIRKKFPTGQISLLAHSFGTWIVGKLLSSTEQSFYRLAFCGSLLRSDFDFAAADGKFSKIVNEIGCRDVWPALAARVSWGYGPTGSFGFNRGPFVEDRRHSKYGHSQFLTRAFCERFWVPFFCDSEHKELGDVDATPSAWLIFVDGFPFLKTLAWGSPTLLALWIVWRYGLAAFAALISLV